MMNELPTLGKEFDVLVARLAAIAQSLVPDHPEFQPVVDAFVSPDYTADSSGSKLGHFWMDSLHQGFATDQPLARAQLAGVSSLGLSLLTQITIAETCRAIAELENKGNVILLTAPRAGQLSVLYPNRPDIKRVFETLNGVSRRVYPSAYAFVLEFARALGELCPDPTTARAETLSVIALHRAVSWVLFVYDNRALARLIGGSIGPHLRSLADRFETVSANPAVAPAINATKDRFLKRHNGSNAFVSDIMSGIKGSTAAILPPISRREERAADFAEVVACVSLYLMMSIWTGFRDMLSDKLLARLGPDLTKTLARASSNLGKSMKTHS